MNEYEKAVNAATVQHSSLLSAWDSKIAGREISRQLSAGTFTKEMIGKIGYASPVLSARVAYGNFHPIGNMEGSLYVFTDDNEQLVRVRWRGGSDVYVGRDCFAIDRTTRELTPRRLDGKQVREVQTHSVLVQQYVPDQDEPVETLVSISDAISAFNRVAAALQLARELIEELTQQEENARV